MKEGRVETLERFDFGVEAGARGGQEGATRSALADRPVEDEPVFEDLHQRQGWDMDREVLVVVALPSDTGIEEDFAQTERKGEPEPGRFALTRHQVVDGDAGDRHRRQGDRRHAGRGGDRAGPDLGIQRAAKGREFPVLQWALRGRLWVDAEARRQVDEHRFQVPDRLFEEARVLGDDLGEPGFGMSGGLLEEEAGGFGRAGIDRAGARLPARLGGFRVPAGLLAFDDVDRLGRRRREGREQNRDGDENGCGRLPSLALPLPAAHRSTHYPRPPNLNRPGPGGRRAPSSAAASPAVSCRSGL